MEFSVVMGFRVIFMCVYLKFQFEKCVLKTLQTCMLMEVQH
jgi:hypothetical protein